ncbi:MAG: M24 family metallopeptidase [Pseudomonadota bacterium]
MNTYNPVLRRGLASWNQRKLPKEEFTGRLQRIRTEMKARDIDVLIIHGDAWHYGDLAYATNYSPMTREAVVLLPLKGDPSLYLALGSRDIPFAKNLTWVRDVSPLPKLAQDLPGRLGAWKTGKGSIGLVSVMEDMRAQLYADIAPCIEGSTVISSTDWYRELRRCKDPREIQLLREAAAAADQCIKKAFQNPIHGRKEFELAAKIDYLARCQGAEDCRILLTSGPDSDRFLRPAGDRRMASGEKILIYLALSVQRYWAELGRTFISVPGGDKENTVPGETSDLYRGLLKTLDSGLNNAPAISQMAGALKNHMDKNRVKTIVTIQGIGLDREEVPFNENPIVNLSLVPGMSVSLRLSQVGPGAGLFFSTPLIVGKDGCEVLSHAPLLMDS